MKTPSRKTYLEKYLATAKRLGMEDDETVVAARTELAKILDRDCDIALIDAARALGVRGLPRLRRLG
jgi:hypothetical protein